MLSEVLSIFYHSPIFFIVKQNYNLIDRSSGKTSVLRQWHLPNWEVQRRQSRDRMYDVILVTSYRTRHAGKYLEKIFEDQRGPSEGWDKVIKCTKKLKF